jgi:hypothetical protein
MIKQLAAAAVAITFVSNAAFAEVSEDAASSVKESELVRVAEDAGAATDASAATGGTAVEEAGADATPSTEADTSAAE